MKKQTLHQENFLQPYNLEEFGQKSHWLLPQVLAFVGSKLPLARNAGGLVSAKATLALWKATALPQLNSGQVITLSWIKHVFAALNHSPRGQILGKTKQASLLGSRYAANVPLVLSAFKEYRNIDYAQWDFSEPEIKLFLDAATAELVAYFGVVQPWSREELLEFQELGRLVGSGANAGKTRAIVSCTSITGISDVEFKKLPRLMKLLLCQCWVYAPEVRHRYAITDLQSLDTSAAPLVDSDIFTTVAATAAISKTLDEMWL